MPIKTRKRKPGVRMLVSLLIMTALAYSATRAVITIISSLKNMISENKYYDGRIQSLQSEDKGLSVTISPDKLKSSNAILVRLTDHAVLMQKNSQKKIYPASLTKIMTAIVAIENLPDLNEEIELPKSIFEGLYKADASMAGFLPGEKVKAIDLLYGAILPSGAECCIALADHISGSEKNFAELMNEKAEALDMKNTSFVNSTGLHDKNHYTTVNDLAILLTDALHNDVFREIFTAYCHFIQPTNRHPDGITIYSTMYEKLGDQNIADGEILGGKTGYTDKAGLCLASLAKVGNQEYILITAGAKGDHNTEQYNITDALAVYSSIGQ